jgi:hypothetical protein
MSVHVKIGTTSWCQFCLHLQDVEDEARKLRIPMTCSHGSEEQAKRMVDLLHRAGFPEARVVDGGCDQQDEPYWGEDR